METRKYPIPDGIKELTADALAELALRLEIEAAAIATVNTHESAIRAAELLEKAAAYREAADFFLGL